MMDRCPTCGQAVRVVAAPFTPEALSRLRAGASAAQLGWGQSFYDGVCRRHGIEGIRPLEAKVVATPTLASATPKIVAPEPAPVFDSGDLVTITFIMATCGELRRGEAAIKLAASVTRFFALLARLPPGERIKGAHAASKLGVTINSIAGYAIKLRGDLRKLNLRLDSSKKLCASGYRLLDENGRPIKVVCK